MVAIETGMIQREIQESAYRAQLAIDSGEAIVVGVNAFTERGQPAERAHAEVFRVDADAERQQIERLRAMRARRDTANWHRALTAVADAARSGANLVPPIVNAVEAYGTVGEIADAMRQVFGEYVETATV
jgi:methylmalonyl-CoA mutase N-terminal domain/subunit